MEDYLIFLGWTLCMALSSFHEGLACLALSLNILYVLWKWVKKAQDRMPKEDEPE